MKRNNKKKQRLSHSSHEDSSSTIQLPLLLSISSPQTNIKVSFWKEKVDFIDFEFNDWSDLFDFDFDLVSVIWQKMVERFIINYLYILLIIRSVFTMINHSSFIFYEIIMISLSNIILFIYLLDWWMKICYYLLSIMTQPPFMINSLLPTSISQVIYYLIFWFYHHLIIYFIFFSPLFSDHSSFHLDRTPQLFLLFLLLPNHSHFRPRRAVSVPTICYPGCMKKKWLFIIQ